jgi:protein-disulfide isomerase
MRTVLLGNLGCQTLFLSGWLFGAQILLGQESQNAGGKKLAAVDDMVITETQARATGAAELDALELQILKSKAGFARSEHQILEKALNKLIEEKLLQAEADKRGITRDELVAKELPQPQEPTNEEIEGFYEANKGRINKPKEDVATQISRYLKQQKENAAREKLLKQLEKEHHVTRYMEPLRFEVNADKLPSQGSSSAPVTLVIFSDFQCPYCRSFSTTIKKVVDQYKDKVRLVFRQYPLTNIHPQAQKAAEASLCAAAQGHFWEMHDLLFQNQANLKDEDLKSRADKLGLDAPAFNQCLDLSRSAALVMEDVRAGAKAGVEGTPAFFINGRFFSGNYPYEEITELIDEELQAAGTR